MAETTNRQKIGLLMLSIFLTLVILEFSLQASVFLVYSIQRSGNTIAGDEYRILCLGESTTADNLGGQGSWPQQLEIILNEKSPERRFKVINEGLPRTTTSSILSKLEMNLDRYKPQMVITMMGVNDFKRGMSYIDIDIDSNPFLEELRTYKLLAWLWENLNPNEDDSYNKEMEYGDACEKKEIYERMIESDANSSVAYSGLGFCYLTWGNVSGAEEMFMKSIELDDNNSVAYSGLGIFYLRTSNSDQAENMFRKAIELDDTNYLGYYGLGMIYIHEERYEEAESFFKKSLDCNPNHALSYHGLLRIYDCDGRIDDTEELYKRAYENGINLITADNYRGLYKIISEEGIKLLIMQYPMRDVEYLRDMLEGHDDIKFISNEENFKEALKNGEYDDYFTDMFAGDFGHCTLKGNIMIAEKVADVVLNELEIN